jgi:MerR family mercuric resistance operon transcriptional regulator
MRDHAVREGPAASLSSPNGRGATWRPCAITRRSVFCPNRRARLAGYRSYDTSHERRLRFVLRARELGFSLDEIRELLRLVDERDQPCAEARAVAAAHLEDVQAKIADLKRMERVLKKVVAQCADGTLPECPLIETLFQEGAVN